MSAPILYAKVGGPPANWRGLEIYLDGQKQEFVTEADVTNGFIERYQKDADGQFIVTDDGKAGKIFRHTGKVEIIAP